MKKGRKKADAYWADASGSTKGKGMEKNGTSAGTPGTDTVTRTETVMSKSSGESSKSKQKSKSRKPAKEEEAVPHRPLTYFRGSTGRVADWDQYLKLPMGLYRYGNIAPVNFFKHAPLADVWQDFALKPGLTVETINIYILELFPSKITWFARIRGFAGYKCLLEYDNFDLGKVHYIEWASFCSDLMKPLGHSTRNRIIMLPPFDVKDIPDYFEKALERNMNMNTVDEKHDENVAAAVKKTHRYTLGTLVEAVDMITCDLSNMKLAKVVGLVGDRVCVKYVNPNVPNVNSTKSETEETGATFIFNVNSEHMHPLGWSQTVGHDIDDIPRKMKFSPLDESYFPQFSVYPVNVDLQPGQYLEVRHPIKTHQIIAAKISKVLKHGYFYVVSDSLVEGADEDPLTVAFHITSPYILQCGFCKLHAIDLAPPFGENPAKFTWEKFLSKYNAQPAPLHELPPRATPRFKLGMKMEAVDETDPTYLGPATIISIKSHLLWLHYDGWVTGSFGDEKVAAEKWMDFESPNLYPAGYTEMVGLNFQGSPDLEPPTHPSIKYNDYAASLAAAAAASKGKPARTLVQATTASTSTASQSPSPSQAVASSSTERPKPKSKKATFSDLHIS